MAFSLDVVNFGVPEPASAREFYAATLSPTVEDHDRYVDLDLNGAGHLALYDVEALAAEVGAGSEPVAAGFRGYVMTFIVNQPTEVRSAVDTAVRGGAELLKPAKKALFGAFSGVYRTPDGAVWKVAAATSKDKGPATGPAVPTETSALLGVADMKAAKAFYEALGMRTDRDYKHYADFHPGPGACRLGLMPRRTLAKDVGVEDGDAGGFPAVVLHHRAASREEVDATLKAATAHGGRAAGGARESADGYAAHFTDPDGFPWKVTAA
ncbi:glyoxalase [Streptomyces calidiresistens]|uniref:Bleomycin resistance protein n=1 Tax=Streptomyces calidiresistens TaxID=1485586 RepID=A0A7W3XXT9_9ACTN|nr:VOC family protein [Streptomyces calidiresistens]MBB0231157.1 bleomycin resistance protein [Streptomyces calidiresistens]